MGVSQRIVETSHARIAVSQAGEKGLPVLLLHGNSSSKEVFDGLLASEVAEQCRLIAIDLPGHGSSTDASVPEKTYNLPGYAAAMIEVIDGLGIGKAAVYGWSLGGYVAIEMAPRFPGLVGLMISGAPPVSPTPESLQRAYLPNPQMGFFGKPEFSAEDAVAFAEATYGPAASEPLIEAARRTDGRARALMFAGLLAGNFADQLQFVASGKVPVAVVDGADDPFVNTGYVGGLEYGSLWDEHCFVLRGAAHVPFLQAPEAFTPILARFLGDMEKRAATMPPGSKAVAA